MVRWNWSRLRLARQSPELSKCGNNELEQQESGDDPDEQRRAIRRAQRSPREQHPAAESREFFKKPLARAPRINPCEHCKQHRPRLSNSTEHRGLIGDV